MGIKKKAIARIAGLSAAAYAYAQGFPFPAAASKLVEELVGAAEVLISDETDPALAIIIGDCEAAFYWLNLSKTDSSSPEEKEQAQQKALELLIQSYFRLGKLPEEQRKAIISESVSSLFLLQKNRPEAKAWCERAKGHYQICLTQMREPQTWQERLIPKSDYSSIAELPKPLKIILSVSMFYNEHISFFGLGRKNVALVAAYVEEKFLQEQFELQMQEYVESKRLLEQALSDITTLVEEL